MRSAASPARAADSSANASSSAVAAIARSGPAPSEIVQWAASPSAEAVSLVIAIIGAHWARAPRLSNDGAGLLELK